MLNCACGGSIMLFSLYAPQFQTHLGYTQVQVNTLSILGEAGMYMTTPIVGLCADLYGPGLMSIAASVLFATAYLLAAWAYYAQLPYGAMMLAFLLIGCGTASIYFGSVTACAKAFTTNQGLSLSLPITAYGLSSLWQSQLVNALFIDHETEEVHVPQMFVFFAFFLAAVGAVSATGFYASRPRRRSDADDEVPLLGETETPAPAPSPLELVVEFASDRTVWAFALGLFMTTGPGEMFLNNMGSMIRSIGPGGPSIATNVSLISLFSAFFRILTGAVSDYIAAPARGYSRVWLLLFFASLLAFGHFFVAFGGAYAEHGRFFWVASLSLGTGYGAIFTLAPTFVSLVWGVEHFGLNWGVLFIFPAVGSIVYEMLYATIYDAHTHDGSLCFGLSCYAPTFYVTGLSCLAAIVTWVLVWEFAWKRRGIFV
ncbi:major facilitator superfamily domain-containing protein [Dipodascopsis tothii]|uniref:major facilitator superfamily domain-containing protein n=1 Tax=Dipodascopsis tothii TaxID=44089 RepID=UPI0034CFECE1